MNTSNQVAFKSNYGYIAPNSRFIFCFAIIIVMILSPIGLNYNPSLNQSVESILQSNATTDNQLTQNQHIPSQQPSIQDVESIESNSDSGYTETTDPTVTSTPYYDGNGYDVVTTGNIEVHSWGTDQTLVSDVEIWSVSDDNELSELVLTGQTNSDGIFTGSIVPNRYKVKVIEAVSQISEVLEVKYGETTSFTAEFIPFEISPYTINGDSGYQDLILKNDGDVVFGPFSVTTDHSSILWVTPGQYTVESLDNDISQGIVIHNFDALPILIPEDPVQTDNAAFGEIQIWTNTTLNMPISASYRIYNATDSTQITSSSTGTDGFVSLNLAPGDYHIHTYVDDDVNPIINNSVTIVGESTTEVHVTFTQVIVNTIGDTWVYLDDDLDVNVESNRRYLSEANVVFYVNAGHNYTVRVPTEATYYYNVMGGMGEKIVLGSVANEAPSFTTNPSINYRVNALEEASITITVTDRNFDYHLDLFYAANTGTFELINSYWVSTNTYRYILNYTAPATDGTYRVELGIQDSGLLYNNFTMFVSDRSTTVEFNSTGYQNRGIDQWIYAYNVHNGATSGQVRTYSDGVGAMTLFDGEYYFRWSSTVNYETEYMFINQTNGPYSFDYQWAEVTLNATAEYAGPISTTIRIYNSSDLTTQLATSSTPSSTGLQLLILPSEIQYSFKSYASTESSSVWQKNVDLVAGGRPTLDFQFGLLAVYTFDAGDNPQDVWSYLYNATTSLSTSIDTERSYSDGISLFTLAPYDNYSIWINRNGGQWHHDIVIQANIALAISNFTNSAPIIASITASPRRISPTQNTTVTVTASDIDPIDQLDYTWTVSEGTILGTGSSVMFVAPGTVGIYQIDVNVTDQFGGWDNTTIWVSSRSTSVIVNTTRGGGVPVDTWSYIQDVVTGSTTSQVRSYADGVSDHTTIYDGLYRVYTTRSTLMEQYLFISGSIIYIDFKFADITLNTTTMNGLPFSASIVLLDNLTQASLSSTSSGAGGLYTFVVNPDTYDLRATASATNVYQNDVTVTANSITLLDFEFSRIYTNVTTGYGQQVDLWTYLYNWDNLATSIDSERLYSDGFAYFDVAPGNYSIRRNSLPNSWEYNIIVGANELYQSILQLGVIVVYTNDGVNPLNLNVKIRYPDTANNVISTSAGTDGVYITSLVSAYYDVLVDDTVLYEDVWIGPEGRTEVGTHLNAEPSIDAVAYTRVLADESTTVTLDITDADYDYPTIDLSVIASEGSITNLKAFHGFIQAGEFRVTFDFNAPSYMAVYMLNLTITDGFGGQDEIVIFLSNQNNNVHVQNLIDDDAPIATSVYFYENEFGINAASTNTGADGYHLFSIPDGIYDIRFAQDTDIWIYDAAIIGGQIYNYTATFGVVEIYVTTTGGAPVDAWTYAYNYPRGGSSAVSSERTYSDGLAVYVLAPGIYEFDIVQTNTITIIQVVEGGIRSIVGTDTPQLDNPPADITYQYGDTGNMIIWSFVESDPDYYNVTFDGATHQHGPWGGSDIIISVDGLYPGVYEFRVYVNDTNGLPNQDTVIVTVTAGPAPLINPHGDETQELATSNSVGWVVNGDDPNQYVIYLDEVLYEDGVWSAGFVNVTFASLVLGDYNVTLMINDTLGQISVDSFTLSIVDTSIPGISSSGDLSFVEGETGQSVSWTLTDNAPDTYQIYLDDVLQIDTTWNDAELVVFDVTGLSIGSHNLTLVAFDITGNMAIDYITITVQDPTISITTSPADQTIEIPNPSVELTWTLSGIGIANVTIFVNEVSQGNQPVVGNELTMSVNTANLGAINITVVFYSDYGQIVQDTVIITVVDTTSPTLTSPSDVSYVLGDTGNQVQWVPIDADAGTYQFMVDSVTIATDSWVSGAALIFNIDGYNVGTHNLTLVVFDQSGNYAVDSLTLSVTLPPADSTLELTSQPTSILIGLSKNSTTLTWQIVTNNPGTYSIDVNGTNADSGTTSNGMLITYTLVLTETGTFLVTLTLVNGDSITLSDTVYITVVDDSANGSVTDSDAPFSSMTVLLLSLIGMGIVMKRKEELL